MGIEIELKHRFVIVQMANNKRELRKLRLQVQMSVDGCIAGPNGEMDWMVGLLDEELKNMNTNYMSLLIPFSWDGK